MLRAIVIYGLLGALVVGAFMVAGSLTWAEGGQAPPENGVVVGYLTQLVALTAVFLGIKHHRDVALGGVIRFFPALGIGLGISAVASLGWVIGWEIVLAMSGLDFGAMMKEQMLAQAKASGASAEALAKVAADAQAFADMYKNPLIRMPISFIEMFPAGVLVSLASAGLLRNSRFLPARRAAAS